MLSVETPLKPQHSSEMGTVTRHFRQGRKEKTSKALAPDRLLLLAIPFVNHHTVLLSTTSLVDRKE